MPSVFASIIHKFAKKTMKSFLAIIFLAVVLIGAWWLFFREAPSSETTVTTTTEAEAVASHSPEFNSQVSSAINAYLQLKTAFVDADTAGARAAGQQFINLVDSISVGEIESNDQQIGMAARQSLGDIKSNATAMLQETSITEMRQDFRMISENLYPFLKTIHYEGEKLYWQNCPMAFGENNEASWISNTTEIVNPYLGRNHPEYKSSMLNCGEIKDTIK